MVKIKKIKVGDYVSWSEIIIGKKKDRVIKFEGIVFKIKSKKADIRIIKPAKYLLYLGNAEINNLEVKVR